MGTWRDIDSHGATLWRASLRKQYAALNRYQVACEYIRLCDQVRVLNATGRPVPVHHLLCLQVLGGSLDHQPEQAGTGRPA